MGRDSFEINNDGNAIEEHSLKIDVFYFYF